MKIPKTRTGSFFPARLAPRRRIDVALHAVVMQAFIEGVSTRRVDDSLARTLHINWRSQVADQLSDHKPFRSIRVVLGVAAILRL